MLDGAAIQLLAREIHTTIRQAAACNSDELQSCGKGLMESFDRAMEVTRNLLCVTARGENELALANSFKHQIQLYLCVMPIQALCLAHASDNIENQSFLEVGTGPLVMNASGSIVGPLLAAQTMQWYGSATFFLFDAVILSVSGILVVLMIGFRAPKRDHYSKFRPVTTAATQGALQMDPRAEDAESSE